MCWSCEKAMLDFLNERKAKFTHIKLEKLKETSEYFIRKNIGSVVKSGITGSLGESV